MSVHQKMVEEVLRLRHELAEVKRERDGLLQQLSETTSPA